MKIFNKFIWSKKEPSNKNDIWFDGSTWKVYTEEAWQSFTLPVDAADTLTKMLENASEVFQEKLNAGYGIVIEGNTISVDNSILYDDSDVWEAIETLQQNKVEKIQLNDYVPLDRYISTSQVLMNNISELDSIKLNKTDVATINGQSLIEGGDIVIPTYDDGEIKQQITELSEGSEDFAKGVESVLENQSERIEQINTELSEEIEKQHNEIEGKASQDGKYPDLTAGFASNLVGRGEAVEAEINFRPSGGGSINDGTARIAELKGNSVVWNQHLDNEGYKASNAMITIDENGWYNVIATAQYGSIRFPCSKCIMNHKYLISYEIVKEQFNISIYFDEGFYPHASSSNSELNGLYSIITSYTSKGSNVFMFQDNRASDWTTFKLKNIQIIDLTKMFGAGNEPTTIEEFYQRIPQNIDINAYNEGELISYKGEALKSVGFNAWDEQWELGIFDITTGEDLTKPDQIRSRNLIKVLPNEQYHYSGNGEMWIIFYDANKNVIASPSGNSIYKAAGEIFTTPSNAAYMKFYLLSNYGTTYNNDICIHLAHTGYRNGEYEPYKEFTREIDPRIREAFADGMKSAGAAYDKVYNRNGKGVIEKRIGVVDLGTLNWIKSSSVANAFVGFLGSDTAITKNIITSRYVRGIAGDDKTIQLVSNGGKSQFFVTDSSYTDAATFKSAMQGVMLYYELAEPVITEYDEPFNLDYLVWDFGTEESIAEGASAPLRADIIYQFNAVDSIRNNKLSIEDLLRRVQQLEGMVSTMQAANFVA